MTRALSGWDRGAAVPAGVKRFRRSGAGLAGEVSRCEKKHMGLL